MRPLTRLGLVSGTCALALAFFAQTALAAYCYGDNKGAVAGDVTYTRYGWKGQVDLHYATPLQGAAIAHPAQVSSSKQSGDFVGWGTFKGVAPEGCTDDFTTSWRIYIDGFAFGHYFCRSTYGTVPDGAQSQFFRIEYTTCPGDNQPKWVFYWNSVWKTCKTIDSGHGAVNAGSESTSPNSQNLRVDYSALRYKDGLGNWVVLPNVLQCETDYPYSVDLHWNAAWDIVQ